MNRWAGGAAFVGAAAIAVIMMLSPASAAVKPAGSGAQYTPDVSASTTGCATAKTTAPHFNSKTGIMTMAATSSAKLCKTLGSVGLDNYGDSESGFTLYIPVTLTAANAGVNVTADLTGTWAEASAGKITNCPISNSYSYSYNYGTYWYNFTDEYGYCDLDSYAEIYGDAYLIDETTGAYTYGNYWDGVDHHNDKYLDNYFDQGNYSNSSYWADNYTDYGSYGSYSGANGAGTFAGDSPTWWFNGTFDGSHTYILEVYMYAYADSTVEGAKAGTASASIDLAGGSNNIKFVVTPY